MREQSRPTLSIEYIRHNVVDERTLLPIWLMKHFPSGKDVNLHIKKRVESLNWAQDDTMVRYRFHLPSGTIALLNLLDNLVNLDQKDACTHYTIQNSNARHIGVCTFFLIATIADAMRHADITGIYIGVNSKEQLFALYKTNKMSKDQFVGIGYVLKCVTWRFNSFPVLTMKKLGHGLIMHRPNAALLITNSKSLKFELTTMFDTPFIEVIENDLITLHDVYDFSRS